MTESPYQPPVGEPEPVLADIAEAPPARSLVDRLPLRLRVFVPGNIFVVLAAAAMVVLAATQTLVFSIALLHFFGAILSGPFAGLQTAPPLPGTFVVGVVNLAALFAHPVWPNRGTAIVSGLGFGFWALAGMAIACMGV